MSKSWRDNANEHSLGPLCVAIFLSSPQQNKGWRRKNMFACDIDRVYAIPGANKTFIQIDKFMIQSKYGECVCACVCVLVCGLRAFAAVCSLFGKVIAHVQIGIYMRLVGARVRMWAWSKCFCPVVAACEQHTHTLSLEWMNVVYSMPIESHTTHTVVFPRAPYICLFNEYL